MMNTLRAIGIGTLGMLLLCACAAVRRQEPGEAPVRISARAVTASVVEPSVRQEPATATRAIEAPPKIASAEMSAGEQPQHKLTPTGQPAAIVSLVGEIDDYTRSDLIRRIDRARAAGARTIIISIDSPGGLVTASMDISRYLKRQTDLHTIAFVQDKAYSGAALVSLACDEIWMAPASVLGDCAPIIFTPDDKLKSLGETERAKEESPIIEEFDDSARRNGYNPLVAEAMVEVRKTVYLVQNARGEYRAVDEAEYKKLIDQGDWQPAAGYSNPIDGPDSLLTVHPQLAQALGLSRGQIGSARELAARLGDPLVADLTPGFGEKLVELLNNPVIRSILLLVFLQSLYISLHAPGHGAAEAVAVVSLGLLIGIPLLTGYAQWWEVAVIFGGLALCAFEIFVFPGHMVSLIVGTVMVLFGLIMTFAGREPTGLPGWLPGLNQTWSGIQHGLIAVVCALVCWFFLSIWMRRFLPKMPYFNRLILTQTTGNVALPGAVANRQDVWPFALSRGRAVTDLKPGGVAEFPYADTTRTTAVVSTGGFVPAGQPLVVEQATGHHVRVRALPTSASTERADT